MTDEKDTSVSTDAEAIVEDRRKFLKKAAKAATVAPAVTLILSATSRSADAGTCYYNCGSGS